MRSAARQCPPHSRLIDDSPRSPETRYTAVLTGRGLPFSAWQFGRDSERWTLKTLITQKLKKSDNDFLKRPSVALLFFFSVFCGPQRLQRPK
jgi:hypothetical protein